MGVVIRWWVWLECICVFSGWCHKEVSIDFLILLIPTPLVSASYCSSIPTSLVIFLMFFYSCLCYTQTSLIRTPKIRARPSTRRPQYVLL